MSINEIEQRFITKKDILISDYLEYNCDIPDQSKINKVILDEIYDTAKAIVMREYILLMNIKQKVRDFLIYKRIYIDDGTIKNSKDKSKQLINITTDYIIICMEKNPSTYTWFLTNIEDRKFLDLEEFTNKEDLLDYISTELNLPYQFVLSIYNADKQVTVGNSKGAGELLTNLFCKDIFNTSKSGDLENGNGKIIETKKDGFRTESDNKNLPPLIIKKLQDIFDYDFITPGAERLEKQIKNKQINGKDATKLINRRGKTPFNIDNTGSGVNLELVFNCLKYNNSKEIINDTLSAFFSNYKYNIEIENTLINVVRDGDYKDFKSFLAILSMYIYKLYKNISIFTIYYDNGKKMLLLKDFLSFKKFYSEYKDKVTVRGWEDDNQNKSFRIVVK